MCPLIPRAPRPSRRRRPKSFLSPMASSGLRGNVSLKVAIAVGNPKPQSRTLPIADRLGHRLLIPGSFELHVIDLVDYADEMFRWPSDALGKCNAPVAESNLAVFASPNLQGNLQGNLHRPSEGISRP